MIKNKGLSESGKLKSSLTKLDPKQENPMVGFISKEELRQNSWNDLGNVRKGVKSFVSVPKEKQKKSVINFRLTSEQRSALDKFCAYKDIQMSSLIRYALYQYIKANGGEITEIEDFQDPNQLDLFSGNQI